MSSDKRLILDLNEQLTNSLKRNSELENKLRAAIDHTTNINHQKSSESFWETKKRGFETEIRSNQDQLDNVREKSFRNEVSPPPPPSALSLNTREVISRVRSILAKECISQDLFARNVLKVTQASFSCLMRSVQSWESSSEHKRAHYKAIDEFCKSEEAIRSLKMKSKSNVIRMKRLCKVIFMFYFL